MKGGREKNLREGGGKKKKNFSLTRQTCRKMEEKIQKKKLSISAIEKFENILAKKIPI